MDIQIFYRIKEEIDLNLALKFLKSPFLEKKLKGLNEINEIIEKVDNHEFQNADKTYYLTPSILADWLISNKILEMLIGELHIEILKRCPEVIKFLCKQQSFPLNLLDNLWNAIIDQHETTVRAGFAMIKEISTFLDV
jgi:hypothetical protein